LHIAGFAVGTFPATDIAQVTMTSDSPIPSAFEFHEAPTQPGIENGRAATVDDRLVLIAEDDEDTRMMYTASLAHFGYRTAEARDGARAVSEAVRLRPDAMVMDVGMPVLDGIDATRLIKSDPRTKGCLVIVVTAHGPGLFDDARAAGADAYVCKPFNPFMLDTILRTFSSQNKGATAEARPVIVKTCGCGRTFSRLQWHGLSLLGRMHVPRSDEVIELRNCTCGSSLALEPTHD
jgi:CheY-like chemotaxis protein